MLHAVVLEEHTTYGLSEYDGLWKSLIKEMFEEFIHFFAPELYNDIDFSKSPSFLPQELFQDVVSNKPIGQTAVQIVKAPLINGKEKWILVHIEGQDRDDDEFRKRMFHYFYQIYDRYNHEIYTIALLTNSKSYPKQNYYDYHYYGTSLIYKYNVFNFKEQAIEELKKSSNPFAAIVLAGVYATKAKGDAWEKYTYKRNLIIQLLMYLPLHKERARKYVRGLIYFIDYLLPTPEALQQKLRMEITNYMKEIKELNLRYVQLTLIWDVVMEDLTKFWEEDKKLDDGL